ncbi:MAG TPA: Ig-like domain-containing protein [Spirochaetota bacterium]|nr:Ig-like domain-containing protein [Spirochaetota bacterium]HOS40603.1 Ig-like domain-containing protein [Spirochaetota bacterium]HPI21884.1 Ig-like domain-containing protein [Spirochaetota bacterium]HPU87210.1 Ig-like domain-containing protein [Spirochaetota bacterium]
MLQILLRILFIAMMTALISCSGADPIDDALNITVPEMDNGAVHPSNGASGVEPRPAISVTFPREMDRPKTEEAFGISSEYGVPRGYFRWDGNRLHYDLIEDLRNGATYTVRVSRGAEDLRGNNIREEIVAHFSVGSDLEKPRVTAVLPADGSIGIARNAVVRVEFSEPIALSSAEAGFSISPGVLGTRTLSDDGRTVLFTPYAGFENKTGYSVIVGRDITDIAGNPLLEEKRFSFMVGGDFAVPTLDPARAVPADEGVGVFAVPPAGAPLRLDAGNLTGGVEKDTALRIVFSKAMKPLEAGDAVRITPAPSGGHRITWTDARTATVSLSGGALELGRVYELEVRDSAIDVADNRLDAAYRFSFKINGPHSQAIFVQDIRQMEWLPNDDPALAVVDESKAGRSVFGCYGIIDLDVYNSELPPDLRRYWGFMHRINDTMKAVYVLRVYFQNTANSLQGIGMSWGAAQRAISFAWDRYHGPGTHALMPVTWRMERPAAAPNAIDLYLFDLEADNYFRLRVAGGSDGMRDALGNYPASDFETILDI